MGYRSNFGVTVTEQDGTPLTGGDLTAFANALTEVSGYAFDIDGDGSLSLFDAKWYEETDDLIAVSKLLPFATVRIMVCATGEDGAQMITYATRGEVCLCPGETTFPPNTLW